MDKSLLNVLALPILCTFIFAVILTPLSLIFIKKIGLFDDPKSHKHPAILHKTPIPRGGGVPLIAAILLSGVLFLKLSFTVISLGIAALLALVIGVLDDKLDVSPYLRFFGNIIVASIIVGSGVTIPFITNPFGGILYLSAFRFSFDFLGFPILIALSDILAILWIVWVMNMLNWSKGVDGQMPGIVAISSFVIGILSLRFGTSDPNTVTAATLSFMIAGASLGFLLFNFYPAKIFPGYGATAMYMLVAAVSILSSAKLATAILVMGVPMIDGVFTIGRRILEGRSPFWHDKKHLHHLLLRLGFGQRQIALFYWVISAIFGALSLMLSSKQKIFAILMLIAIVGGTLLFLHSALKNKDEEKTL